MNGGAMNTAKIRALIVLAVIVIILGVGINWLYSVSYINVTVSNASNKALTYTFTNQKSNQTTTLTSSKSSIKKRLQRGNYNVQVTQGDTSLVAASSAPGFFRTGDVEGKLSGERARSFVGNNPSPCMVYTGSLYSFACGASLQKVNYHVPATATTPTYTTQPFRNNYATIEDSYVAKNGSLYILVNSPPVEDVQEDQEQVVYKMEPNGTLSSPITLKGISDTALTYKLEPYKDGFVAYDNSFKTLLYYPTPDAEPTNITIEKPKNEELTAFDLETSGDAIVIAYSTLDKSNVNDTDTSVDAKNEIVVYRNNKVTHTSLESIGSVLDFCGTNKLCMLANESVAIYDVTGDKPSHLYSYSGVSDMSVVGDSLIMTQQKQIVNFDPDTRQGYVAYSLGGYTSCGQGTNGNNLLLCLTNNKSQKVALLLDLANPVTDPIDKQVFDLQKQAEVTSVSAYKNFISVAPNYGRVVLLPGGINGYDPAVVNVVNGKINAKVKELGINQNTYTIGGLLSN